MLMMRMWMDSRDQFQPCDQTDAGKRFTAESKRGERVEILRRGQFGCRKASRRESQILRTDPAPIVNDLKFGRFVMYENGCAGGLY